MGSGNDDVNDDINDDINDAMIVGEKLFSNEKHFIIDDGTEDKEQGVLCENTIEREERFYKVDELKDVNENINVELLKIYRKSIIRSYTKTSTNMKILLTRCCKVKRVLKNFLRVMIALRSNNEVLHESESKIFLNKYTNYNSWCFFYKESKTTSYDLENLRRVYNSEIEKLRKIKINNNNMSRNNLSTNLLSGNRISSHKTKGKKKKRKDKMDHEKALLPAHVQNLANISSFLCYFHILNIMKNKFLSAHSVYAHVSFTLVFFVW
ncbi:conserved Plasmodium membrane protein, unknown function [Plasmodium malariae]|uniref:Uncharacterized protein n=1 Tax=Plasmodium malariae TaxID=5858 RepID=A0A1A8WQ46_PLAMA|nr:conserved Plasmodium membrane protein, unknown function [Plasmodium malariae]